MRVLCTLVLSLLSILNSVAQTTSTTTNQTDVSCSGTCDGSLNIFTTGGQMPYVVSGNFGNSPQTYTSGTFLMGFCAGTHVLTIQDSQGSIELFTVVIGSPDPINLFASVANESSAGACDGQIAASTTGGMMPYTYTLNGGTPQSSNVYSGLCAGSYALCVTDANGCTSCDSVTVSGIGCVLTSTIFQQVNASCNGSCDGYITLSTSGGQMPYTATGNFANSPVVYTSAGTLTGFCAGTHVVTITDPNGCTEQLTVIITEPSAMIVSFNVTNESAPGACDGQITASVTGGTPTYTYTWSTGQISPTITGLCPGSYILCVADSQGCVVCDTATVASAGGCVLTSAIFQQVNASCNGACDGYITLSTSGGQMPYTATGNFANSPVMYTSAGTLTGFCAGTHVVTITDPNGCTEQFTVVISGPQVLNLFSSITNESSAGACDGQIAASTTGGMMPYTYTLNGGTPQSSNVYSGLCAGSYALCVTDANGCTSCDSVTISGIGCVLTSTIFQQVNASCNGACDGYITLSTSGGQMPYTATGNFANSPVMYTSAGTLTGFCAGTHVVTITDPNGCTEQLTIVITEPFPLVTNAAIGNNVSTAGACDATLVGTATGGTGPYTYIWIECDSNTVIGTTSTVGNLCEGDYALIVIDNNGCADTTACINVSPSTGLSSSTLHLVSFYPNPTSGILNVNLSEPAILTLLDISGRLIYTSVINQPKMVIDIANFVKSEGIYLIVLDRESGRTVERLIFQK